MLGVDCRHLRARVIALYDAKQHRAVSRVRWSSRFSCRYLSGKQVIVLLGPILRFSNIICHFGYIRCNAVLVDAGLCVDIRAHVKWAARIDSRVRLGADMALPVN